MRRTLACLLIMAGTAIGQTSPIVIDTTPGATPRAVLVVFDGKLHVATTVVAGNAAPEPKPPPPAPAPDPGPPVPAPTPDPLAQTDADKAVASFLADLRALYSEQYRATAARIARGDDMAALLADHVKSIADRREQASRRWIQPILESAIPAATDPTPEQRRKAASVWTDLASSFWRMR